ncbi:MAG: FtsX-like permease family protein [Verrucomicrobia bacterium]|nr:FtsX-like permease family protein [Verrucomicrobiota bacterium]MCH8510211.1 ABC transporter permease [Kiritimatiellia bacterium]
MLALHRKLIRDLMGAKGQTTAIAVVVAAGVMTLVVFVTSLDALTFTQQRFYEEHQFAEVFADLTRAPKHLEERIRDLPGVDRVETRVRAPVRVEVEGFADPIRGEILSLPSHRVPLVNRLYLRSGSLPGPEENAVAVNEVFAEAHGLEPGDSFHVVIRGSRERLRISGIVLSPEFVYQIGPGDLMPDYKRYGVFWMNEHTLANAFAMDGAFNNVALTLSGEVPEAEVIDALDHLLSRYGGVGAVGREDQTSHRFVMEELNQIEAMTAVLPAIFLGTAAFLLHVLMGRMVRTQREQIAVLKAFGYSNGRIAIHYAQFTGLVVLLGAGAGLWLGARAAHGLAGMYMEYFRFPEIDFRLRGDVLALALLVAGGAALVGAYSAVKQAAALPPAEAMRPAPPPRFHKTLIERSFIWPRLAQTSRMILRNLSRHPVKACFSVCAVGISCALLVVGTYQFGAIDHMMDVQYRVVLRMDAHLTFTDPIPDRALGELRHKPGVLHLEGYRSVPVRLTHGTRREQTSILGMKPGSTLRQLVTTGGETVVLPPDGLVMTDYLAAQLGIRPGDLVEVEVLEGRRQQVRAPLVSVVSEPMGVNVYMDRHALNRLLREGPALSGVWMMTEPERLEDLFRELSEIPALAGMSDMRQAERNVRDHIDGTLLGFMGVVLALSMSIAFAVVYNNARISLAERERELATLRVLGFTRGEVAWVLVGEVGLITVLAIPFGWLVGTGLARLLSEAMTMDLYRVPFVITPWTYAFSAAAIFTASFLSLLLMFRRVWRLDMVSALKSAE